LHSSDAGLKNILMNSFSNVYLEIWIEPLKTGNDKPKLEVSPEQEPLTSENQQNSDKIQQE